MIAVAARHGRVPMTCKLCHDPKLRQAWGCDGPAQNPVFYLECVRCQDGPRDPACQLCRGQGLEPVYECPWRTMPREVADLMILYDFMKAGLGFPADGGVQDQAALFLEAVRLIGMEENRYAKEQERARGPRKR